MDKKKLAVLVVVLILSGVGIGIAALYIISNTLEWDVPVEGTRYVRLIKTSAPDYMFKNVWYDFRFQMRIENGDANCTLIIIVRLPDANEIGPIWVRVNRSTGTFHSHHASGLDYIDHEEHLGVLYQYQWYAMFFQLKFDDNSLNGTYEIKAHVIGHEVI